MTNEELKNKVMEARKKSEVLKKIGKPDVVPCQNGDDFEMGIQTNIITKEEACEIMNTLHDLEKCVRQLINEAACKFSSILDSKFNNAKYR